jgi:hypothetical protein
MGKNAGGTTWEVKERYLYTPEGLWTVGGASGDEWFTTDLAGNKQPLSHADWRYVFHGGRYDGQGLFSLGGVEMDALTGGALSEDFYAYDAERNAYSEWRARNSEVTGPDWVRWATGISRGVGVGALMLAGAILLPEVALVVGADYALYDFGHRVRSQGQGVGEAMIGTLGDLSGIESIRRAISDDSLDPEQRGELLGSGAVQVISLGFAFNKALGWAGAESSANVAFLRSISGGPPPALAMSGGGSMAAGGTLASASGSLGSWSWDGVLFSSRMPWRGQYGRDRDQYGLFPESEIPPTGNNDYKYKRAWHDQRATEIFGPGRGRPRYGRGEYDKFYKGRDIEFKSDNFGNRARPRDELVRMIRQVKTDAAGRSAGVSNPHWHFDHDPGTAPEMRPVLYMLEKNGIPWTFGAEAPF